MTTVEEAREAVLQAIEQVESHARVHDAEPPEVRARNGDCLRARWEAAVCAVDALIAAIGPDREDNA